MKIEIVVNISRTSIQFLYSQNGNSFKPFKYENQELIPFYIFADGDEFQVGETAKLKHQNHLPNCFHNYFELIKNPNQKYLFLDGEKKQIKYLLVHTCETILNNLMDKLLISEHLSDLKSSLHLNLLFSSDINDDEINFVSNLFREDGYHRAKYIYGNYIFLNYLDNNRKIGAFKDSKSNMGSFKGYIFIDSLDNDLHIDFFNSLFKKYPKIKAVGEGLASDPKVKVIARELFKRSADATGSLTSEESELPSLLILAQKYTDSTKSEFRVKVTLSDGASKNVLIKMSKINRKLDYLSNFTKDIDAVKAIVNKTNIENTDLAIVVSSSVKSKKFVNNLRSNYNNVYHSGEDLNDVLDLFNYHKSVIINGDFFEGNQASINSIKKTKSDKTSTSSPEQLEDVSLDLPKVKPSSKLNIPENQSESVSPQKSIASSKPPKAEPTEVKVQSVPIAPVKPEISQVSKNKKGLKRPAVPTTAPEKPSRSQVSKNKSVSKKPPVPPIAPGKPSIPPQASKNKRVPKKPPVPPIAPGKPSIPQASKNKRVPKSPSVPPNVLEKPSIPQVSKNKSASKRPPLPPSLSGKKKK
jgi:hypothetical protein